MKPSFVSFIYNPVLFVEYPNDIAFCSISAVYPLEEAIEIARSYQC